VSETLDPARSKPLPADSGKPARLPLQRLNSIWFQITGLLCNLECTHCLVDSSPRNTSMEFLSRETIQSYLKEVEAMGVKEVYFTGGEPFLHKEMVDILEDTLGVAPATVLTNGTLITERMAGALGDLAERSGYSLEIRVSMDHPDPERNDSVRGPGAHAKALRAVLRLQEVGLLPIVTATEYLLDPLRNEGDESVYDAFLRMLSEAGVQRPRLKVLPVFHTGKLEDSEHGGPILESMMCGIDPHLLQCAETRVVTTQGIYACPILVGKRVALMNDGPLIEGLGDVELSHHACRTCYDTGMTCGNF
jgi:uncharacterized Fe-S cluster-containing radical SAM superfamily protein